MKYNHNYILLRVKRQLDKKTVSSWLNTVNVVAPTGTLTSASVMIDGVQQYMEFYERAGSTYVDYVIPLTRDLSDDEAARIAIVWDRTFTKVDFVIDFSQHEQCVARKQYEQQQVITMIADEAAKRQHTEWVNSKVAGQWSYGPRYSHVHLKHPMLLPWDQLPKQQQQKEIDRIVNLFDFLASINLRLSKK